MAKVVTIGQVPWTRKDMIEKLEEFALLYEKRPIKNNTGGMKSPHMFLTWFALHMLKPKAIIESGVWRGQGTWFFEKACPEAELHCIDINLGHVQYKSDRAEYYDQDFSTIDWGLVSKMPKDETVVFFDDHQNAYERLKMAKWFGFKHVIFEDNYPPSQGDCYSLKKAFMHSGFVKPRFDAPMSLKVKIKQFMKMLLGLSYQSNKDVYPNEIDAMYLRQNLEIYHEFPPIFRTTQTRWDDTWDDDKYPTPEPLLNSVDNIYQQIYLDEATSYTWMCYVKLK